METVKGTINGEQIEVEITKQALMLANQHEVNPLAIGEGSGKEGRIIKSDVKKVAKELKDGGEQFEITKWKGQKNYECNTTDCRYSTLDKNRILAHQQNCNDPEPAESEGNENA